MGGCGSGRRPSAQVKTVEAALKLDIHAVRRAIKHSRYAVCSVQWQQQGSTLNGLATFTGDRFMLVMGGRIFETAVVYRKARFGGVCAAYACASCARCCYTIFAWNGKLVCRRCARLVYESQRKKSVERAYLKAQKLRARLHGQTGTALPNKPRGMWSATYRRLVLRLLAAQRVYYSGMLAQHSTKARMASPDNDPVTRE